MGETIFTPTLPPHLRLAAGERQRTRVDVEEVITLGFAGFLRLFANVGEYVIGGQGWIRTSVRKTGQIYSLLPLTTRPPVHIFGGASCVGMRAGPAEEAAQWRKGPCLSMPQVGKEARTSSF